MLRGTCSGDESEALIKKYVRTDSEASAIEVTQIKAILEKENKDQITLRRLPRATKLITCPTCFKCIEPRVRYRKQPWTYYLSILLTLCLLCWIPHFSGCMQGKVYYCPNCNMCLGQSDVFEKSKLINGYS